MRREQRVFTSKVDYGDIDMGLSEGSDNSSSFLSLELVIHL